MEQLNNSHQQSYDGFSKKALMDALFILNGKDGMTPDRTFSMMTGQQGASQFHDAVTNMAIEVEIYGILPAYNEWGRHYAGGLTMEHVKPIKSFLDKLE